MFLYVPPVLTLKNSKWCSLCIDCFFGISEQTTILLYTSLRDELVTRIMKRAAILKQERQDDLRRTTRTVAKRVEKCIEVDGGIFENSL